MANERPRGRPRLETPHERIMRLERELSEAREAAKIEELKAYSAVGRAVLAAAKGDDDLRSKLAGIIEKHVPGSARAAVTPLLAA